MINITAEFETRTVAGLTQCKAEKTLCRNYRDVLTVEDAINYVKAIFNNKKFSNQCIDFEYEDENFHRYTVIRFFRFYGPTVNMVTFDVKNPSKEGVKAEYSKLTTKMIKEAYLACADMCIEMEEKEAV